MLGIFIIKLHNM